MRINEALLRKPDATGYEGDDFSHAKTADYLAHWERA